MKIKIDGAGLAGTILALQLSELGQDISIFDNNKNVSSYIAAGIMNPVTGKRMSLTYNANKFFDSAITFYKHWQKILNLYFFHELPLYRPYVDLAQKNDWAARNTEPHYAKFIINTNAHLPEITFINPLNCLQLSHSGWLNVPVFLQGAHAYLKKKGISINKEKKETASWDLIIDCSGWEAKKYNHLFAKKPFTPMKGEIITIESKSIDEDKIISGGCFICPIGNSKFKVGSTYDWKNIDTIKTDAAINQLINKLEQRIRVPYTIINHQVGIRPVSKDRKPLLGYLSENKFIINGLGSKGVSMGPLLIEISINALLYNKSIPKEMNIERYRT